MSGLRILLRLTAAGLAFADGMLHAAVTPEHFAQARYLGILFVFSVLFLSTLGLALTYGVFGSPAVPTGKLTRWAGILLVAGLLAGYFATRTIGFPGFSGHWGDFGLATKGIEALLLVLLVADLGGSRSVPGSHTR
ncbi:hypothetical protein B0I33_101442 [Prauserella shujinwangii]|uniref:Uncharacterized protein n=1 Tax=Prauserella shujinwangii TaxID=1453103 RepID=A0A2T0M3K6_9PSEU|nr:hypothetical protein [Prauserella shujinwangii]PRX51289.1 hypothetical protein B0I33_101442 [Prauserella shujinwangii]